MSPLQRRIAAVTNSTSNLVVQLRELDQVREQVRKASLSAKRAQRLKAAEPFKRGQQQMSDEVSPPSRFLVRQGYKGWTVYDRQRKAPAVVGTDLKKRTSKPDRADTI